MVLTLIDIKENTCKILRHFAQFCQTNNIRFYLSNGTLLGAIKYNGFIPWDDDIDVFIPRCDYDRFIETYQDNHCYKLFSRERDPKYRYTFAKLCDMDTLKVETDIDNGVQLGIGIDVFPLDSCSEHILLPRVQKKIKRYQVGCILSKFTSSNGKPLYKRFIILCCRVIGYDFFHRGLEKVINNEIALGNQFSGCLMWPIYGKREIIPSHVFSDIIEVDFEGAKYPAPIGYDLYLRSLYGDYKKDPPLEKQKTHHSYTAYYKKT